MKVLAVIAILLLVSGCATYIPPGAKADLQAFKSQDIHAGFETRPSNPFPASIAVVRVQSPSYSNHYLSQHGGTYGSGRYSVVLAKELNEDVYLERINRLEDVNGLVSVNRLLLPDRLEGDGEIRAAASRLQADLVFLYTFDTSFFDTDVSKPLTVVTLGLSPTRKISAITTCSGLLLDTRTGYIYSAYEVTERAQTFSTSWGSRDSADEARRENEQKAFERLVDEFVNTWPKVLERHKPKAVNRRQVDGFMPRA
ncbi:MAG: hypothetical protein ACFHX7_18470 [Pseudomonadota bacterium]